MFFPTGPGPGSNETTECPKKLRPVGGFGFCAEIRVEGADRLRENWKRNSRSLRSGRDDNSVAVRRRFPIKENCRSLGCPGFPVKVGGVANSMRFSLQKTAHAALSSPANRKSGYARDDKGEGSAHLSSCYTGLGELYAEREANDPSIHITNCRGRNKSTLCHPDRSVA